MKKIKVIVCGTGFGKFYLKALAQLSDRFEVVGIFSKGSQTSKLLAQQQNIPLFTSFSELDQVEIDLACVVIKSSIVGGSGTDLAVKFLNRGIHVLQEHPIDEEDYVKCVRIARHAGCYYKMNTFYHTLEAPLFFLKLIQENLQDVKLTHIKAECSIQVLFPLLDMIGRITKGFTPHRFENLPSFTGYQPFSCIAGEIKSLPTLLLVKNEMNLRKPETNISLLHRIEVGTTRGTLTLTDTHGAILWTPHLHEHLSEAKTKDSIHHIPTQEILFSEKNKNLGDILSSIWPKSLERSLIQYYECIVDEKAERQDQNYALSVCQVWQQISQLLGPCREVRSENEEPISLTSYLRKSSHFNIKE